MGTLLGKILKKEQGQALAEYQVLIPGSILLIIAAAWLLAGGVSDAYCQAVTMFDPSACEGVFPAEEEATPEPEEDEECVPHEMTQGSSQCEQSEDCAVLPGVNNGEWNSGGETIDNFVIKAGQEYHIFETGITDDGCYFVDLSGSNVSWQKMGHGPHCKDISHMQSWFVPLCNPAIPQ